MEISLIKQQIDTMIAYLRNIGLTENQICECYIYATDGFGLPIVADEYLKYQMLSSVVRLLNSKILKVF